MLLVILTLQFIGMTLFSQLSYLHFVILVIAQLSFVVF